MEPNLKTWIGNREEGLRRLIFFSFLAHVALMFVAIGLHSSGKKGGQIGLVSYHVALVPSTVVSSLHLPSGSRMADPPPPAPRVRRIASTPPVPPKADPDRMVDWWKKNKPNLTEIPDRLSSVSPNKKPGPAPSSSLPGRRDPAETERERPETPYWSARSKDGEGKLPAAQPESAALPAVGLPKAGPTISVQGERENDPYNSRVQEKISQNWKPPMVDSVGKGFTVEVEFSIRRDGSTGDVTVKNGSGNSFFDQAALRAVLQAKPFPPFVPGTREGAILFRVRFGVGELS